MKNSVSLLDIYNVLQTHHHHQSQIYADICRYLAEILNLKTVVVNNVNLDTKEIKLFVERYEVTGNRYVWEELIIIKIGKNYNYHFKPSYLLTDKTFKNPLPFSLFFKALSALGEYTNLNNYLLFDINNSYYISISADKLKVQDQTKRVTNIFIDSPEDLEMYHDYLSNIYVDTTNLPLWLQNECELIKKPKPVQMLKRMLKSFNN